MEVILKYVDNQIVDVPKSMTSIVGQKNTMKVNAVHQLYGYRKISYFLFNRFGTS